MHSRRTSFFAVAGVICLAAGTFLAGFRWGLPSRDADRFLFASQPVWPGQKIYDLAGAWDDDPQRGADVARNPLADRQNVLWLNQTPRQQAQLLLRYRLYSCQPDEASTPRALSVMRPARLQLDPRLYQYGGLWIYPVGGMTQLASSLGWVHLTRDVPYYLDHPEEFARFYLISRAYSAFWGFLGVIVVFALVRRLGGGIVAGAVAAACFALMPVVINMAHEGKPHLGGAVLALVTVLAGSHYVESGKRRWWIVTAIAAGAAFAMVLSGWVAFGVIPTMVILRPNSWKHRSLIAIFAGIIALGTYAVANPYVVKNLICNRAVLQSNLGTSTAMYQVGVTGAARALELVVHGTSPVLAAGGALAVVGALVIAIRRWRRAAADAPSSPASCVTAWLLAAPVLLVGVQFIALAQGKPDEYARFALLPDVALAIAGVAAADRWIRRAPVKLTCMAVLLMSTGFAGSFYVRGFVDDAAGGGTRWRAAQALAQMLENKGDSASLAMRAEPAPYCLPPVDLFRWKMLLLPRDTSAGVESSTADVSIRTTGVERGWFADEGVRSETAVFIYPEHSMRIGWANPSFQILKRLSP